MPNLALILVFDSSTSTHTLTHIVFVIKLNLRNKGGRTNKSRKVGLQEKNEDTF